ncbi:reverse transcriptase domain-containing protein [Tanacetum coccineum]
MVKEGAKNLAADHMSRLENPNIRELSEEEVVDKFPNEHLMILKAKHNDEEPWYADYVNYIVRKVVPPKWTPERRKWLFSQVRNYFWDEPYAFRLCPDNVMRRCMAGDEILKILAHCHSGLTREHHSASITERKVYKAVFYWPGIFKDAKDYGLDFMGPFSDSRGNRYILVVVDYVSKWVEAQALPTNDTRVVVKFLKGLFSIFVLPKALISDRGTHFFTNRAIKHILKRSVGYYPKDWSEKLNDALWAFRTAYKTPIGCTPFRMVYVKACHLPVEIKHKEYWALKQCNMDLTAAAKNHFMELNELMELRDRAYENTRIYKDRTKKWHDSKLRGDKDFKNGDKVLLFNSRLKLHPGKLKSKWSGPFIIQTMYPYGAVEITDKNGSSFKVNSQRTVTVAGARETVGNQVVQYTRIQCFNCKEYGHFAKECRKSKRVKDYSYYKKKMMLFKKEEKGVPLNVEQSDWLQDTNEEPDEQELEEHYMYMAKIQEVLQVTDDNFGPTYDTKPLEHVPNDIEYNVFAKDKQHSKQPKTINDTYVMETIDSNVIPDHSDMCNNEFEDDQNADDNDEDECVKLSNLIANSKLDIDENKKIQKQLRKANATLTH